MQKTLKMTLQILVDRLKTVLPDSDQQWFEAEVLLGEILKQDRTWLATHPEAPITEEQFSILEQLCDRRLQSEPLAYILKHAPFFGHSFFVDEHVLIPRPESEWLVKKSLKLISTDVQSEWLLWETGTGSGCLSASIAYARPTLEVLASDISTEALVVAQKNVRDLGLKNVHFFQGSLLSQSIRLVLKERKEKHWLIVANLPYLPFSDRTGMQTQVIKYEPAQALFAEEEGLALIKELLQQLKIFLDDRRDDIVLLEHDPRQAQLIVILCQKLFPHAIITTEQDQNGANRFTVLQV